MTLHNTTDFEAGYNLGLEKSGHHCLVVVAKATFNMPHSMQEPATLKTSKAQIKVHNTDVFTGIDGESALLYENDFAPFKPKCDVILNGSAYAYPLQETTDKVVQLRIGTLDKSFRVIGKRIWQEHLFNAKASNPEPFIKQFISYDIAYGGNDLDPNKPSQDDENYVAFDANPVGQGYAPHHDTARLIGKKLAQTMELHTPATDTTSKKYLPQSFGAIARHWYPRYTLGGTYDAHWVEHVKPFLPDDFDESFYQCSPEEQQIPYIEGGEKVMLKGLTPEGERLFILPRLEVAMEVIRSNGTRETLSPIIDTLILEPDEERFTMVYRAKIKLKRSIHEVDTIIVGTPDELWEKKRLYGECYEEDTEDNLETQEHSHG
jgi:hypothetical protein